jgi:hypothetical protein
MPTLTPVADRLTFRWWPAFEATHRIEVEVTERVSSRREKVTAYGVEESTPVSGGRVFLVLKLDDPDGTIYEVFVGGRVSFCSCKGAVCRAQAITCRHAKAVRHLITEGAF